MVLQIAQHLEYSLYRLLVKNERGTENTVPLFSFVFHQHLISVFPGGIDRFHVLIHILQMRIV